jgi:hypothetical protein
MHPAHAQAHLTSASSSPPDAIPPNQQLLKPKRREEYRERVNELFGTAPNALTRLPDVAQMAALGPKSGPNALFQPA